MVGWLCPGEGILECSPRQLLGELGVKRLQYVTDSWVKAQVALADVDVGKVNAGAQVSVQ
eukprot:scaffold115312_cov14-Prasinocladus_malaysianus.AAC.1